MWGGGGELTENYNFPRFQGDQHFPGGVKKLFSVGGQIANSYANL